VTAGVDEDLKLIRQIVAGGGRKYTAGNIDRSRYDRLVDLGWLIPFKANISDASNGRRPSHGADLKQLSGLLTLQPSAITPQEHFHWASC
jgi:hypothetical protein